MSDSESQTVTAQTRRSTPGPDGTHRRPLDRATQVTYDRAATEYHTNMTVLPRPNMRNCNVTRATNHESAYDAAVKNT